MLRAAVNVAGRLGFDLFEQHVAKCFTSILADVHHSIVLSGIVSNFHDHSHRHDYLQHTILRTTTVFSRFSRYMKKGSYGHSEHQTLA
jgi:hypothetical protein